MKKQVLKNQLKSSLAGRTNTEQVINFVDVFRSQKASNLLRVPLASLLRKTM